MRTELLSPTPCTVPYAGFNTSLLPEALILTALLFFRVFTTNPVVIFIYVRVAYVVTYTMSDDDMMLLLLLQRQSRSPLAAAASHAAAAAAAMSASSHDNRPPMPQRMRSPASHDSQSEAKKPRPSVEPSSASQRADDSDDEKSDQDLVVDEVTDVSSYHP